MAHHHGPQRGARPHPPRVEAGAQGGAGGVVGRRRRPRGARLDGPRRRAPPALHLLPSCAEPRCAGGAVVAHALRSDDAGDRRRVPRARGDDGPANRPGEAQDRRGPDPLPGARRSRAPRSTRRRPGRRLRGVHRSASLVVGRRSGQGRPGGGGHPPRPADRRAHARRAGVHRPPRARCSRRTLAEPPGSTSGAPRAARRPGPDPVGPRRHRRGRRSGRLDAATPRRRGRTRSKRPSPASTASLRRGRTPTGPRSPSSTACSNSWCRRPSSG